ncbi:HAD family hydrolase [Aeoliella sp.]|uniref:HAD family hydrolase n=1 Tax=Aeoliella sp. TaxID=2795800 RepID=UPI003CCB8572
MTPVDIIRTNSQPLAPQATDAAAETPAFEGIRAVLFDVYGTLFISASGDISLASLSNRGDAVVAALESVGLQPGNCTGDDLVAALHAEIKQAHQASEHEFPEVDIHKVWRAVLKAELDAEVVDDASLARLAVEYETQVNPVWPMPGLVECLAEIHKAGLALGIVSNAQAFTRELFPALANGSLRELGFEEDLCVWSYEHLQAKPGRWLYERAVEALATRGIAPSEALYVGNDMRNDVAPAAAVGFRTVLFAGDARSLRLREGDAIVAGVSPDAVVTDLRQILHILRLAPEAG